MYQAPTCIASALLLCALLGTGQPGSDRPPVGHPSQGSPHQSKEQTPAPEAAAADVASVDAIIGAMYDAISGPKGEERDWGRLRSLFLADARYIAARPGPDGSASAWFMSSEDFIALTRKTFERGGYFEAEVGRRTEQFGNIAHVWSTYEARYTPEAEPHSRGIYSIQLFNDGSRWWIVNAFWAYEREDAPIPAGYLGGVKE